MFVRSALLNRFSSFLVKVGRAAAFKFPSRMNHLILKTGEARAVGILFSNYRSKINGSV